MMNKWKKEEALEKNRTLQIMNWLGDYEGKAKLILRILKRIELRICNNIYFIVSRSCRKDI